MIYCCLFWLVFWKSDFQSILRKQFWSIFNTDYNPTFRFWIFIDQSGQHKFSSILRKHYRQRPQTFQRALNLAGCCTRSSLENFSTFNETTSNAFAVNWLLFISHYKNKVLEFIHAGLNGDIYFIYLCSVAPYLQYIRRPYKFERAQISYRITCKVERFWELEKNSGRVHHVHINDILTT